MLDSKHVTKLAMPVLSMDSGHGRAGLRLRFLSLRCGMGTTWLPLPGEFIDGDRGRSTCEAFHEAAFCTHVHDN